MMSKFWKQEENKQFHWFAEETNKRINKGKKKKEREKNYKR